MSLLIKYEQVFSKIVIYHKEMQERFEEHYTETEKSAIKSSTKDIKMFFLYIQQQLLIQTIYLMALCLKNNFKTVIWLETMFDISNMALLASYIWMIIGITASITRAFKAHYKQ